MTSNSGRFRLPSGMPTAVAAILLVLGWISGCGSGSSSKGSAALPTQPGPAWIAVLDQIRDDGSVSTGTALVAFALAFGPLPGVEVPPGDPGMIPSGTAALRWLVGHWNEITPEQRGAAESLVPELAGLEPAPSGSTDSRSAASVTPRHATAQPPAGASMTRAATQQRSNFFYTQFAQQVAGDIASRVGASLDIPIDAHVGTTAVTSAAETGVYTSSGGFFGTPGKCVITINPSGDALVGDPVGAMIAHEVWHCFEGYFGGLARYWSASFPSWISEGEAEWVGASMYPGSPLNSFWWPNYLNFPEVPLLKRSYTAIGFYSQLASSGIDVWLKLIPIVQEPDSAGAFQKAGADGDQFLYQWAPGYLRSAARGSAWDIVGPGVTSDRPTPTPVSAGDGAASVITAAPYANALAVVGEDAADVLEVSSTGHVRVSDGSGRDYLAGDGGTFCHRQGGCECPDGGTPGAPPMLTLPGPEIVVAVTGGQAGATGTIAGVSLDQFCKRVNVSGTWTGEWATTFGATGGFTVTLTQTGTKLSGPIQVTGQTCLRAGTVQGTINGKNLTFGFVEAERELSYSGTVSGSSMSGTFSGTSCESAAVTVDGTWQATKVQ